MEEKVIEIIADQLCIEDKSEIKPETSISKDLGGDSLDKAELVMKIESDLGVTILDEGDPYFDTVGDVIRLVKEKKREN